jgi:hypothetical protein
MYLYNESLSLRLGSSPLPPSPSFFMLFGPVCPPTPKIISPKSLPNNTWWEKTNNNQSNNLCYRTQLFWLCVICSSFLLHPCPQPPGLARVMYDDRVHGWQIERLSFISRENYLCNANKFSSYTGASCGVRLWRGKHLETMVVAWIPMH